MQEQQQLRQTRFDPLLIAVITVAVQIAKEALRDAIVSRGGAGSNLNLTFTVVGGICPESVMSGLRDRDGLFVVCGTRECFAF